MLQSKPDSSQYSRHLAKASEVLEIHACEDIRNTQGLKLISRGDRLNTEIIERVVRHKLLKPIDASIAIIDAVTPGKLVQHSRRILEDSSPLGVLLRTFKNSSRLPEHMNRLHLEPIISNKLTVMQRILPDLFEHSLRASCIAIGLGFLCDAGEREIDSLAGVGVLHDLGCLHLDPALLDPNVRFDDAQWRQMQSHPIVGFLTLRNWSCYADIAGSVLEHHERMDGSGYPRKLDGSHIGKLGRIIAVGEMVMGILQKYPVQHLAVAMKTQHGKFDEAVMLALTQTLNRSGTVDKPSPCLHSCPEFTLICSMLEDLLANLRTLHEVLESAGIDKYQGVLGQIDNVNKILKQSGYSSDYEGWLSAVETDDSCTNEVFSILCEVSFDINQIIVEMTMQPEDESQRISGTEDVLNKIGCWLALADQALNNGGHKAEGMHII